MLVYLSGPMTGYDDDNFPAFNAAAAVLRSYGHVVLNPAETGGGTKALTRTQFLYIDVGYVQAAEAIVMLPGWEDSKGALLELHIAHALGKPAYHYNERMWWGGVGPQLHVESFLPVMGRGQEKLWPENA